MVEAVQADLCGPTANYFIERWFGDCVYSKLETFAFCLGLSSMFFWLIAQLPQFINNILRQSADALSPWFLVQWLAGDSCNLLGCVLTGDQLATQTITAGYFIFADFIILTQYFYYQHRNRHVLLDVYYSDSDESLHKPTYGYNELTNSSKYSKLDKLCEQSALGKISQDLSEVLVKSRTNKKCPEYQLHKSTAKPTLSSLSAIPHCRLSHKKRLTQVLLPDSEVGDELRAEVGSSSNFSMAGRDHTSYLRQILCPFSVSDLKLQNSWMYEHRHRLRRLVQEYGLEYGQETVSRLNLLYTQRHKGKYVNRPMLFRRGSDQVSWPSKKARFKAVVGVACLFGLASSTLHVVPSFSHSMEGKFGSVVGRRTLLAIPDIAAVSFEENLSKISTILGLNPSSSAWTSSWVLLCSYSTLFWTKLIGRFLGWVSSVLYLGSRFSQIVKNKQRGSAEGLSLGMFACAVLANLTYGISIFLRASSWENLIAKAPWLLGSIGTVFLDFIIFIQAHYYGWHSKKAVPSKYTPLLLA